MKLFVACDYGQLEARVIAMFSKDKIFVKALWERYDVHAEWARRLALAYPDRIGGKKNLDDKVVMKTFRNDVKNQFVFPLFFGATLHKTSNELSIPMDVVKPLYHEFWKTFSGVKKYQESMEADYKRKGYIECLTGRRRRAPLSYNQTVNSSVQGTASDLVVDSMNRLSEMEVDDLQPVMNIHDDLSFVIDEKDFDEKSEIIIKEMLNCRYDWVNVPIVIEMSVSSTNWAELQPIGDFSSDQWLGYPNRPQYA